MEGLWIVYLAMGTTIFGAFLGIPIGIKIAEIKKKSVVGNVLEGLPEALKMPADAFKDMLKNVDKKKVGKLLKDFGIKTKIREKRGKRK